MKFKIFLVLFIFPVLYYSCKSDHAINSGNSPLKEIDSPCLSGGEPNLFVSELGTVFLSWIEYEDDTTDVLLFSKLTDNQWTKPLEIARGSDWFVNWADFPSLVSYEGRDKFLAAHWLQKSSTGTYDYDVHISQSNDGGNSWMESFIPHRDGIAAEHGFVTMVPISEDQIFATWLDGRFTKEESEKNISDEHGHTGTMTLRSAIFDKDGNLTDEVELDHKVCDCCQTAAIKTDKGLIVAYRDRSNSEIRDISVVRQTDGKWSDPYPVYNDNWEIAGCPVNGPSIDALGQSVAIVWFTMIEGEGQVKVAFSNDYGANFQTPIRIDEGNPLGRVELTMISSEIAMITWLEAEEQLATIKAMMINAEGKVLDNFLVAESSATRKSGFPRMVKKENEIVFAWTQNDSISTVKTALWRYDD